MKSRAAAQTLAVSTRYTASVATYGASGTPAQSSSIPISPLIDTSDGTLCHQRPGGREREARSFQCGPVSAADGGAEKNPRIDSRAPVRLLFFLESAKNHRLKPVPLNTFFLGSII